MSAYSKKRKEFGDFQTPDSLCRKVCDVLVKMNITPRSIIEPTCGVGGFLRASVQAFANCESILGFEVNPNYAKEAGRIKRTSVECVDFFSKDWPSLINTLPKPILVIGNPPWVTNATMGTLGGTNLPVKSNLNRLRGFDALTGKSNFDISEWMLNHLMKCLSGHSAVLAVLCKTMVARKVLRQAWKHNLHIKSCSTYSINALEYFGASVDACLFLCTLKPNSHSQKCAVYKDLDSSKPVSMFALHKGQLIANTREIDLYDKLYGPSPLKWRSGVKHDCTRIMELRPRGGEIYENGLGHRVQLESTYLFPMLKSSEVAKGKLKPSRYMLVTQKSVGEDTEKMSQAAPLTWSYLEDHADYLDRRLSSIYRNRPRFCVFGIGKYAFAPWKVAISGFYKQLHFRVIPPFDGKPVMLDDTCYFLPCQSESDSCWITKMLHSHLAQKFFNSHIFWDAKRPITAKILGSLNLKALSKELGIPWSHDPFQSVPPPLIQR